MMSRSQRSVELVLAGMSQAEAARAVGVASSVVSYALRRRGIFTGLTDAGRKAISGQWKDQVRIRNHASKMRQHWAAYQKKVGNPEPKDVARAVAGGLTYSQAADKFGISRCQVAGYVWRLKQRQSA